MEIQKSSGIILQSRSSGEADTIATVFTGEYGKRTFIFKGLRKSKKRPRSAVEPGSALDLVYYYRENRPVIVANEFTLLQDILEIRDDLGKILNVYYMLETVDRTTAPGDPAQSIYNLLYSALNTMKTTGSPLHLTVCFTLHLLHAIGILPSINTCAACGKPITTEFRIQVDDFHAVCGTCCQEHPDPNRSNPVDPAILKFVHEIYSMKFNHMAHEEYTESQLLRLLFPVSLFLEHYFHTTIKSKSLLFDHYRQQDSK